MYLVRRMDKTGQVQVYETDGLELAAHGRVRKREPKAWRFNKGYAALDHSVSEAMLRLDREVNRETLDS